LQQAGFVQPCRYADWVSSIVPVEKKNTRMIRICVDFRNLNRATPKDEYPIPVADLLINIASGNKVISFLDNNASCNQIFIAKDVSKTAFRCLGFIGLFEWVVMTFVLKNAGATYQRAMNLIFHNYALVEYDLAYELLRSMKGQVVADFIVDHVVDVNHSVNFVQLKPWGLYFDGSICSKG
jgi:hypothetical protein